MEPKKLVSEVAKNARVTCSTLEEVFTDIDAEYLVFAENEDEFQNELAYYTEMISIKMSQLLRIKSALRMLEYEDVREEEC